MIILIRVLNFPDAAATSTRSQNCPGYGTLPPPGLRCPKYQKFEPNELFSTSAVPVEHETLKWGRYDRQTTDAGRTDMKGEIFM